MTDTLDTELTEMDDAPLVDQVIGALYGIASELQDIAAALQDYSAQEDGLGNPDLLLSSN
jgi:hypothetical protein